MTVSLKATLHIGVLEEAEAAARAEMCTCK